MNKETRQFILGILYTVFFAFFLAQLSIKPHWIWLDYIKAVLYTLFVFKGGNLISDTTK